MSTHANADIFNYEAPFLKARMVGTHFDSENEFDEAFSEFIKFMSIVKSSSAPVGMFSKEVDSVWHEFIIHTKQYFEFCQDYFGRYIHHIPTENTKDNRYKTPTFESFKTQYEKRFGQLSPLWATNNGECWSTPGCSNDVSECWTTPGCSTD